MYCFYLLMTIKTTCDYMRSFFLTKNKDCTIQKSNNSTYK